MTKQNLPQPIQIIGTQRSGSNLFRLMLNQLDKVIAPHPPHILKRFAPFIDKYSNNGLLNFEELTNDVCQMVELNPVKLVRKKLDRSNIIAKSKDQSLVSLFYAIYDHFAEENEDNFWVCKSMGNMNFADQLEKMERKPYYIYLSRDGRDVACSFKKAIVGEKHIYHLAQKWKKDQEQCIAFKAIIPNNRFHSIKYEKLIQHSEKEIQKVCEFLVIPFESKILNYHESSDSQKTASSGEMWSNVSKPVMNNNFNKFKKLLTKEEIIIFEHIAGDILLQLGYDLLYAEEAKKLVITTDMVKQFNKENDLMKEKVKKSVDTAGQKLREGQNQLIKKISYR